ncbi:MAG: hypothetical protein LBH29_01270 [Elusimicrobiota bacterium]|nr:hypothetical protein [Elusimicrobiota bacterium]
MFELLQDERSVLWLKLRAISRKELFNKFIQNNGFNVKNSKQNEIFEELYAILQNKNKASDLLDDFIRDNLNVLSEAEEESLVSELYKLKYFDWAEIIKTH